ncbi:STAS domain-containing protein [Pseudobacillus wudalianchiensis]|nr:STAS domain-containing protein [Bacillus wudalianchiensis]
MKIESFNRIQVMHWEEDITLKNIELFRAAMLKFTAGSVDYFVLDLKPIQYINSAGLGIIAESVMNMRKQQKDMAISGIGQSIEEIFAIVKFTAFIKLFPDIEAAINFFEAAQNDNPSIC